MSMILPKRFQDTQEKPTGNSGWIQPLKRLGVGIGLLRNEEPHLSVAEARRSYQPPPSFGRFLPIRSWDPNTRLFVLEDWASAAAILELSPVDAEARSEAQLENMLQALSGSFVVIPERSNNPWVIQLYLADEPLHDTAQHMRRYAEEIGTNIDQYSEHFLTLMKNHLIDIGKPGGVFEDTHTRVRWGGRLRRARLVLTRRFAGSEYSGRSGKGPHSELDELARNLAHGLSAAGVESRRIGPSDLIAWLYPWLNPKPAGFTNSWERMARHDLPKDQPPRFLHDLMHSVLQHRPISDPHQGTWLFDGQPHRYLPVVGFREEPRPGLLTLEQIRGRGRTAAFFDRLPVDTVFALTLIFVPKDRILQHLEFVHKRALSDNAESKLVRMEVEQCQAALARGNRMIQMAMGFFTRGQDLEHLHDRMARIQSLCQEQGLDTIDPGCDLYPLDEYVRYLPCGYHPEFDRYFMRQRFEWLMNALAASPLWGKANGSGKPGFTFFDRAGQPVMLDILNPEDRDKAPHAVILGPTGTGKSALLNYLAMQVMALHRPHLYIIDVGDSFRLLGDYFHNQGLSVHYLRLKSGNMALPPFADSHRMLSEQIESCTNAYSDDLITDQIDFLGEMETAGRMIITGCDPREERLYSRQDRTFVRSAVVDASIQAKRDGKQHALISGFINVLESYTMGMIPWGFNSPLDGAGLARIQTLHANARLFLDGTRAKLFDRTGSLWPQVDVTIVDFGGIIEAEDSRDILQIAFISLMNAIQRDAERRRGSGRQSLVMIDEAHVTTTNPLLADYLTRGSKMWRKWGLWLWLATQSLSDFPNDTRKILSMAEFWFCLSMPKEEIDEVGRFRHLSDEDVRLLSEARKSPGRYSEGVLLSGRPPMLFRNVPPAIALALAQTEEAEVTQRKRIMEEENLDSEIEAVEWIAEKIREARRQ
ncbi:MAG: conjugative transfer ATPase [Gammaproteobacteria bacterium]|nr:conjugative transfer ATPase [Gammaproteobacteria bacterium]